MIQMRDEMSHRNILTVGRSLIGAVAAVTAVGPFLADWNETHIYNPAWPPHAKFHNAQTMSMGVALGLPVLYYLWKPVQTRASLATATIIASIYGLTQLSVALYPEISSVDPPGENTWPQLRTTLPSLGFVLAGYLIERRRITRIS